MLKATGVDAFSSIASLVCVARLRTILHTRFKHVALFPPNTVTAAVHRFEESIAGRVYRIEVAAVSEDRWRAHIARQPGVPNAIMPFYGRTPDEAARQLSEWLTRAHERASAISGSV